MRSPQVKICGKRIFSSKNNLGEKKQAWKKKCISWMLIYPTSFCVMKKDSGGKKCVWERKEQTQWLRDYDNDTCSLFLLSGKLLTWSAL